MNRQIKIVLYVLMLIGLFAFPQTIDFSKLFSSGFNNPQMATNAPNTAEPVSRAPASTK